MSSSYLANLAVPVVVLTLACGKSSPTTGSLAVEISAPDGSTPEVTVTGPRSYSARLSATQTLGNLVPGPYTVSAGSLIVPGATVSTAYDPSVSASPVTVTAGAGSTVQVSFTERTGSAQLWYSDSSNNVVSAIAAGALSSTGAPTPTVGLALGASSTPTSIAFDTGGNLWMSLSTSTASSVVRLAPRLLGASGSPTVTASFSDGTAYPVKLAFDSNGNLWVAHEGANNVVEFPAAQLQGQGTLTVSPAVTVTNGGASVPPYLSGMALDSRGNMWVAYQFNFSSSSQGAIYELTAAQLGQSGNPVPAKTLTGVDIVNPRGLAFDSSGNLWVANTLAGGGGGSVVRFDASELTGSSSAAESFVITSSAINGPSALAFDEAGNLWVANQGGSAETISRFAASQIVGTGPATVNPDVVLTTSASLLGQIAFDPAPAGLPLLR